MITEFTHGMRSVHLADPSSVDFEYLGIRPVLLEPVTHFTYDPNDQHRLTSTLLPLYTDGRKPPGLTGTSAAEPTLLLPDDGFSLAVSYIYSANCGTPSGTNPVVSGGNVLRRDNVHPFQAEFSWGANGPIPSTMNPASAISSGNLVKEYNKPLFSLPAYTNISSSQTCWDGLTLGHTALESNGHTRVKNLWVAVDERSGSGDGMEIDYIGYSTNNGGSYTQLTQTGVNYLSGSPLEVISTPTTPMHQSTNVQYKVCASTPCIVPLASDHNNASAPGDEPTIGDAEVLLYSGWACDVSSVELTDDCNAVGVLRYIPSIPQLQVPNVQVEALECDSFRLTMEILSTGSGSVSDIEIGSSVSMSAGTGWSYVPGSAQLLDAAHVLIASAGSGLPDPLPGQGCGTGSGNMTWGLGSYELCATNTPIPSCARMFVQFDVERPTANCGAMSTPIQLWASSLSCGVPCQIISTTISSAVAPSTDVVTSVTASPIADCQAGTTLVIVVNNPLTQALYDVNVSLDLPAALTPFAPISGCATSVQVVGGVITWNFTDLLPATPCTLSVQVTPLTCSAASHNVSVIAATECCALSLGGEAGIVEVIITDPPLCSLEPATLPTPSLCNGPWGDQEVLCGIDGGQSISVVFNGDSFRFINGGAAFVEYTAAGVWTLTGELENLSDSTDRYWVQLYFDNPLPNSSWPQTAIMGTVPMGETWTIYSVSTNPSWPSLFVGAGTANVGQLYSITGAVDSASPANSFGFQRGNGASGNGSNYGVGFNFLATPVGGGSVISGVLSNGMYCGYDWTHYFSPCNGQLAVNWNNTSGATYTVNLYHDGQPVSPSPIMTQSGSVIFPGLCNGVYDVTISGSDGCTASLGDVELENGLTPLTGWVEFPATACSSEDACVRAVAVGGGQAPYEVEWWWQTMYYNGYPAPPVTQPGDLHCGAVLGEESWARIIDANDCHITQKYYIQEVEQELFSGLAMDACGGTNGSIALTTLFDTSLPYTVAWTGPGGFTSTSLSISGLAQGMYVVEIWSFAAGCRKTAHYTVGQCGGTQVEVVVQTDANAGQTSWQIFSTSNGSVACSGSGYPNSATTSDVGCILPDGCYRLVVSDAAGDGIVAGGYRLSILSSGDRIIDELYEPLGLGGFANGSTSAIANNEGFCLPLGVVDRLIGTSCDRMQWRTWHCQAENMICTANPAVSAEYGITNTTSGYQMWWFDPNGGYSFRRTQYHSTSNGMPAGPTRACHFRLNTWSGNQLQDLVLYNVRVRGIVNGVYQEWGKTCRMMVDNVGAQCPRTKLLDQVGNQYYSCGVTRTIGSSVYVHANPTTRYNASCVSQGANKYQFRFRIPSEGFSLTKSHTSYFVNTTGLTVGKTYEVDVRVSFDNGTTWCANGNLWGDICTVTIVSSGGMVQQANDGLASPALMMWPNPNATGRVFYQLQEVKDKSAAVHWRMYDAMGRQVMDKSIASLDELQVGEVELSDGLGTGLFLVEVTIGDKRFIGRLVLH
ncbi:MAG: T9SS type A sorting domain-containing protein [Flavobacteriales bacterium]|nr:T9SS type A sorting domain-containing protein [Flavobacteriales bacterium]